MSIEAMKQALEALEENHHLIEEHEHPDYLALYDRRIHALRTAIEQAEKQEPVGMVKVLPLGEGHKPMHWADWTDADNPPPEDTPLYTTPPAAPVQDECVVCGDKVRVIPRPWVGLTDEERNKIRFDHLDYDERARAIEAKLREKNGGAA